eukprot:COSAG02_NODE_1898_length_10461_cov_3.844528_5_plen_52_part_00
MSRSSAGSGQACCKLTRDAGLMAVATTYAPSDLSLMIIARTQRVLAYAVWA